MAFLGTTKSLADCKRITTGINVHNVHDRKRTDPEHHGIRGYKQAVQILRVDA
jgi:hypothetical protein